MYWERISTEVLSKPYRGLKILLTLQYGGQEKNLEFLVIPSLRQNLICGIDFWEVFGFKIISHNLSELAVNSEASSYLKLSSEEKEKLDRAIAALPSFEKEGLGNTTFIEHIIYTGTASPIKQRYYPISPAREKLLCEEIDRMLALGVIEIAENSPWSSPGVLLVKPNKVRFCLDSRRLNSVTVKDAYPIPNIDGIISRLPPVNVISKMDLKDAFWQINLSKESRPKTAFTVPNRPLYQFVRMPFGLCNAPQTMCRLMDKVIPYHLKNHIFVYLDDLLVVSHSLEDHIIHLLQVASRLREAGLTINIAKSQFGLKQVKFLGFIVGNGTLMVDPEKVEAIAEYPVPKTAKQLRQFLGLAGWYRRFVNDYASISFHLTELLSKKKSFQWNQDANRSFESLKQALTTAPFLAHPDYLKPFIVQCDASKYGVGGLLAQCDENGDERPIAFMSHKLNKAQRNYTVTELECLAVVLTIKKFRSYIEGHEFKVVTDHASLKWLMNQKDLSGRLARWALKLQGYNFKIEHRKGCENVVADALSRSVEIDELEIEVLPAIDLDSEEFESNSYKNMLEQIKQSNIPDFRVEDKYIYYRADFNKNLPDCSADWKLVVPDGLKIEVLYSAHNPPNAAHGGIAKTLERVRKYFYWPGLVSDVRKYVNDCELCKTSKVPNYTLRPPMQTMAESNRPFERLYVDLIGPFPRTGAGNIGIFIVLDHMSKFVFLKPLKKFSTGLIMTYLKENIFDCFGVPESLVSDNGSQFRSKDFKIFLNKYGVKHILTAVHSPQANASERVNRSVNEALRSYIRSDQRNWDKYISDINSSLRNSIHQSLGESPYKVVFGQTMITHGNDYNILRKLNLLSEDVNLNRMDKFSYIRELVKEKMKTCHARNANSYNLRSRYRVFEKDQIVTRRNFTHSNLLKNYNAILAPTGVRAKILKRLGNSYYIVQDLQGNYSATYHAKDLWI